MEQRDFIRAGLEYVCLIQEVQERKKFEFVETVSEHLTSVKYSTILLGTVEYVFLIYYCRKIAQLILLFVR